MNSLLLKQTAVYGSGGAILAGLYEVLRGSSKESGGGGGPSVVLKHVPKVPYVNGQQSLVTLLVEIEPCIWKCDRVSWLRLVTAMENLIETRFLVESDPGNTSIRDRVRAFSYYQRFKDSLQRITVRLEQSDKADVREVIRIQRLVKDVSNHAHNHLSVIVYHTRDVLC
jgi:hypothetical protein